MFDGISASVRPSNISMEMFLSEFVEGNKVKFFAASSLLQIG